jgi:hypothetical protein
MSQTDDDVSSVKDEFLNDGYCPYCHSGSTKRKMLEGHYSEKEAIEVGYWYRWDCKCQKCGREWFGMDYYHYEASDYYHHEAPDIPHWIRVLVASLIIGVIGSVIGGFFSNSVQYITDANVYSNDFGFAIPGIISGFFICFLGSMWFLSILWNRDDRDVHLLRGWIFGTAAGALSSSISIIFIDLIVCPGWFSGEDTELVISLLLDVLFGALPGAVVGFIAAIIITVFPGKILLGYVNRKPVKPSQSDSAPTEKK